MNTIQISRRAYQDKVYACWLGKNIGGTLGAPYECKRNTHALSFYEPIPDKSAPNDDLDLQLVWLDMLEQRGLPPKLPHFAEFWKKHTYAYPWNEYGFCMRNMNRGLMPPVSGWFENYFVDEMGSPIRSELWACLCPANPQRAAALAWMDSAMDHAGGEGTYGEMFWAAVESAAFVISDPLTLIRIGLAMIPPSCNIARVIREALWCHRNHILWGDARERIALRFGHIQPCNAIPNHGFTILGWLYGDDFGDKLCKAVNCGYDTDCTGATLGATLGILAGTAGIPKKWSDPIGTDIVLHRFTLGIRAPRNLTELTKRTFALAEKFQTLEPSHVIFGDSTITPADIHSTLLRNELAVATLQEDITAARQLAGPLEITLHYHGEPVFYPHETRRLSITATMEDAPAEIRASFTLPAGWIAQNAQESVNSFDVTPGAIENRNTIRVHIDFGQKSYEVDFTILGPDEAQGFPAGDNVPYCPVCQGTKGACICG